MFGWFKNLAYPTQSINFFIKFFAISTAKNLIKKLIQTAVCVEKVGQTVCPNSDKQLWTAANSCLFLSFGDDKINRQLFA